MNDTATTNAQLAAMVAIARDMGLQLDELGHPYREVPMVEEGEQIWRVVDFDPIKDLADAMRVQVHYGLALEQDPGMVMVRDGAGPILIIMSVDDKTAEGRLKVACEAIVYAAAKVLAKRDMQRGASSEGR